MEYSKGTGDVVRRRLDALLAAERPEHRAGSGEPGEDDSAWAPAAHADGGDERAWREPREPSEPGTPAVPPGAGVPVPPPALPTVPAWPVRLWGMARAHVAAVAIVVAAGVLWAAFSLTQASSVPLAAVTLTPAVATPKVAPSSANATIVVHVLGAVAKPGVVRLSQGARVGDAIAAAGGLKPEARPGELNLAALVDDGSQIKIGTVGSPTSQVRAPGGGASGAGGAVAPGAGEPASAAGATAGTVNLNTATQTDLDALPGVGPVTANAILAWRQQHGRFSRVEELQEVDGIGPKTFEQLAPKVRV